MTTEDEDLQDLAHRHGDALSLSDAPCVHLLIEAQAARTPNATALIFGDQHLTYQQLNRRANQLAHHLRERGVGPDVLVGVALERGLEMVIG
ncbi:AMP-binding protein, partial [Pseudomonas sp. SIMBA_059]